MNSKKQNVFSNWIAANAVHLSTMNPDDPLDDLEPLRNITDDTRVIALGESSHFIKEFCTLRHRILRFLVEHCGFTIYALEFGFSEGFPINKWVHGDGGNSDLAKYLDHFYYPPQLHETFRWMRNYNLTTDRFIEFAGLDIPRNGGSFFPSLHVVQEFLTKADPDALPMLAIAAELAKKIDGFSTAQSASLLHNLSPSEKNALTASVARLLYRLEAMAPVHISEYGQKEYDTVFQHLKSVCYLDYNSQAMADFMADKGLPGDMGAKDKFMADSVLWHLKNSVPDSKMVLVAHNAHIQKTPITYDGFLSCLPMGQRLAYELGNDYMAFGITSESGNTAALYPDENSKFGFRIESTTLEKPIPESIEACLANADLQFGFISFRNIPEGLEVPKKIRFDSEYLETSVIEAFDGVFQVPVSTVATDRFM